jgi:hypothetical protein
MTDVGRLLEECKKVSPHLSQGGQFVWGAFGGVVVVFLTALATGLSSLGARDDAKARGGDGVGVQSAWDKRVKLLFCMLPIFTGIVAVMIEAPTPFMAVFEVIGTSTMLYFAAAHLLGVLKGH